MLLAAVVHLSTNAADSKEAPAASPRRIVALAPSAAEILFALGAADRVVGLPDLAFDLPGSAGKARIGGFTPDLERVVALRPDLIVASRDGTDRASWDRLRDLGLGAVATRGTTLEGVFGDIRTVGDAIGEAGKARRLVDALRARVGRVRERVARSPVPLPTALVVIWPDPPIVAGPSSFLGDLLRQAGLPNAVPEGSQEWPRVSFETLSRWNPGVVVRPETAENEKIFGRVFSEASPWRLLAAVRERKVIGLPGNWLERPGPRLVDAMEGLADRLLALTR